jgi:hypothetical protein
MSLGKAMQRRDFMTLLGSGGGLATRGAGAAAGHANCRILAQHVGCGLRAETILLAIWYFAYHGSPVRHLPFFLYGADSLP